MSLLKDHKKPRRDRIAREAEEAEALAAKWNKQRKEDAAYNAAAIAMITEGTRLYFARRVGWNYPHIGSLQVLLDVIRLEFYRYQKELGIGGHKEGCTNIPDDPGFGRLGRNAMSREEQKAQSDYEEGKGPMPWFLMGDTDGPAKKP